jgi:putative transposase
MERPSRKRLRLDGYDYARAGAYFVTICTAGRRCCLAEVVDDRSLPSDLGDIVSREWSALVRRFPAVQLDTSVVMPNHVHGIIMLGERGVALPAIMRSFKSSSTVEAHRAGLLPSGKLWQRGYHDHVIRDDAGLTRLREYIANNPLKWHLDENNPAKWRNADAQRGPAQGRPPQLGPADTSEG